MSDLGPSSTASDLAAALRRREISSSELLDACLAAVDERNPALNAIALRNDEQARAAAADADRRLAAGEDAPFLGVPIPVKDLTPVAGWPVTFGSNGAPRGSQPGERDGRGRVRARRLRAVRAHDDAGVRRHHRDRDLALRASPATPGTRSALPVARAAGRRAAVSSGMFPIAHANDGGGSIRIPASYCGLVGLKPSRGRVPRLSQSWLGAVVEGVVARSVQDAAVVLDATSGPDPCSWYNAPAPARPFAAELEAEPPRLRIGLMANAPLGIPTDPACVEAAQAAAELLEGLGHHVEPVEVATISEEMVPPFIALTQAGLRRLRRRRLVQGRAARRPRARRRRRDELLRLRAGGQGARAAQPPRGRPLGPRLRRPAHAHLGDPAAGRGIGAGGPAQPRPTNRCRRWWRACRSPPSGT